MAASVTRQNTEVRYIGWIKTVRICNICDRHGFVLNAHKGFCCIKYFLLYRCLDLRRRFSIAIDGTINCIHQSLPLCHRVLDPIGGPNTVDFPAHTLQNILTKAIPLSSGSGGVVGSTIALNTQHIASAESWMLDSHINTIAGATYLRCQLIALAVQEVVDRSFKGRIMRHAVRFGYLIFQDRRAIHGKVNIAPQQFWAIGRDAISADVRRKNGADQLHIVFGAGNGNIQTTLPACFTQRTKVHSHNTGRILSISDTENNRVPLIALDVFQALDKESLLTIFIKERFILLVLHTPPAEHSING